MSDLAAALTVAIPVAAIGAAFIVGARAVETWLGWLERRRACWCKGKSLEFGPLIVQPIDPRELGTPSSEEDPKK
ncbi:hypothetical protein [Nonomuraea soli]|uniref:Uncharacterized protein n=1 Tax=Nonomuraea soli TaxID=1032476 RepID=A0A7W0CU26_9ACTN|nr:hypothetical protein [Nonomuraea soli]MBA2897362.1 hypothetical protein [Nonomuraea soli]